MVVLGAVWVTVPRQIDVVAEEEPRPIYFEVVEEEEISSSRDQTEGEISHKEQKDREVEEAETGSGEIVESEEHRKEEVEEEVGDRSGSGREEEIKPVNQVERKSEEEVVFPVESVVERAKVVAPPVAIGRIQPVYPKMARRKGREGSVVVEAKIAANGAVDEVRVVSSSGFEELDRSAAKAVESARFEPAAEDNQPIAGEVRMTFEFKLTK